MSPKCPVIVFALPGTAWVGLRSEKWEQYYGLSAVKGLGGTGVWMGCTSLDSEQVISSPVSALDAFRCDRL